MLFFCLDKKVFTQSCRWVNEWAILRNVVFFNHSNFSVKFPHSGTIKNIFVACLARLSVWLVIVKDILTSRNLIKVTTSLNTTTRSIRVLKRNWDMLLFVTISNVLVQGTLRLESPVATPYRQLFWEVWQPHANESTPAGKAFPKSFVTISNVLEKTIALKTRHIQLKHLKTEKLLTVLLVIVPISPIQNAMGVTMIVWWQWLLALVPALFMFFKT